MSNSRRFFSLDELAEMLEVSYGTVLDLAKRNEFEWFELRKRGEKRITRDALVAYMTRQRIPMTLLEEFEGRHGRHRILVVEDEKPYAVVLARTLSEDGRLEVDVAHSVTEAALKIGTGRPEVLLLDWKLGGKTGEDLLATARETLQKLGTKVILISIKSPREIAPGEPLEDKLERLGVEHWVSKVDGTEAIAGAVYAALKLADRRGPRNLAIEEGKK